MTHPSPAMEVRTRFAPSPTGSIHLGSLRTALFTWLWARHCDGKFILRIEDTDSRRFDPDSIASIVQGLQWLGLKWDEGPDIGGKFGPYTQSERRAHYQEHADWLLAEGHAYRCFCSPQRLQAMREAQKASGQQTGYDRTCRELSARQITRQLEAGTPFTVRLKMPLEGTITFPDLIRGDITVDARTLQDPVLLKSDGMALYHLAVVVDDRLMKISHVLRGQEWLATAPYHHALYDAFGWEPPVMVHLPVILNPNGKGKMSKRRPVVAGESMPVHVHEFRDAGYEPDAVFNFLSLLGWTPDAERELFDRQSLIEAFELTAISPSAAAMPYDKLLWMNGVYIRGMSAPAFRAKVVAALARAYGRRPEDIDALPGLSHVLPELQTRMKTMSDSVQWMDWLFVEADQIAYDDPGVLMGRRLDALQSAQVLRRSWDLIESAAVFEPEPLHRLFRQGAEAMDMKAGSFFGPVRGALSGSKVSPPLFAMMACLGPGESQARISRARARLLAEHESAVE